MLLVLSAMLFMLIFLDVWDVILYYLLINKYTSSYLTLFILSYVYFQIGKILYSTFPNSFTQSVLNNSKFTYSAFILPIDLLANDFQNNHAYISMYSYDDIKQNIKKYINSIILKYYLILVSSLFIIALTTTLINNNLKTPNGHIMTITKYSETCAGYLLMPPYGIYCVIKWLIIEGFPRLCENIQEISCWSIIIIHYYVNNYLLDIIIKTLYSITNWIQYGLDCFYSFYVNNIYCTITSIWHVIICLKINIYNTMIDVVLQVFANVYNEISEILYRIMNIETI